MRYSLKLIGGGGTMKTLGSSVSTLEKEQQVVQSLPSNQSNLDRASTIEDKLRELYKWKKQYRYTRTRALALTDEDQNTSYFHPKAKFIACRNTIQWLLGDNDEWNTGREGMTEVIKSCFPLYLLPYISLASKRLSGGVSHAVLEQMIQTLLQQYYDEETQSVVFHTHLTNAPRLGGMHMIFPQRYWYIVGKFSMVVCNFKKSTKP